MRGIRRKHDILMNLGDDSGGGGSGGASSADGPSSDTDSQPTWH